MRKRAGTPILRTGHAAEGDEQFVTSLARGLSVLRAFRRGDNGLGNQELAERTGLAKSTISRLTYTLAALGYLNYSQATGRYTLSVATLSLGFSVLGNLAIRDIARPLMQALADKYDCSVAIGAPDQRTMIYVEHCRGQSPLHIGIEVGSHVRMATTAMGRAYLASLPADARESLLDKLCPPDDAGHEMRAGVAQAARQLHSQGYVTSLGEWKNAVNSVGVPLILHGSQPYALNCGGSALVLREQDIERAGRDLVELAANIRLRLGAV
jgi:DNA-binding IclR family transcriptional regulator